MYYDGPAYMFLAGVVGIVVVSVAILLSVMLACRLLFEWCRTALSILGEEMQSRPEEAVSDGWDEQNPSRVAIITLMAGSSHATSQHPSGSGPHNDPSAPGEWAVVAQEWSSFLDKYRGFRMAAWRDGRCHVQYVLTSSDAEAVQALTAFFRAVDQWQIESHPDHAPVRSMLNRQRRREVEGG